MKKNIKPYKVIIDTDPGVDDAYALVFAMFDEDLDIKLLTTVSGNVKIADSTRNLLHLLDRFDKDIPVAKGASRPLYRRPHHAYFIHGKYGMGNYVPPKKTKRQLIEDSAVEAMYKILKENPGEVTIYVWGPHTNVAQLLLDHPDAKDLIPQIIFMGGSPYGMAGFSEHISFNISNDPEAFKIVLDSKIPLVMAPSDLGRKKAFLTEKYVNKIRDRNEVGAFLFEMFDAYWEPGYEDKRVATNDTCAYLYLTHPKLFKTMTGDLSVDTKEEPGKTLAYFHKDGNVKIIYGVKRRKFLKLLDKKLSAFDNFKLK